MMTSPVHSLLQSTKATVLEWICTSHNSRREFNAGMSLLLGNIDLGNSTIHHNEFLQRNIGESMHALIHESYHLHLHTCEQK